MQESNKIRQLDSATIMMVDDEPLMMDIVQAYLEEEGYSRFVTVSDSRLALQTIQDKRPDILLLDLNMPNVNGFEILSEVRGSREFGFMPVIVLTSVSDPGSKLRALEIGATDFLSKPVDQSELLLRLRNTLAVKAYQDHLTYYDELTKLPNRKRFVERLTWQLAIHSENRGTLSIVQFGIDRFKQVRDTIGVNSGDELLRQVGSRIQKKLNGLDAVGVLNREEITQSLARVGDSEFAFILPGVDHAEIAGGYARNVQLAFERPFAVAGEETYVSVSAGVAVYPYDGKDFEEIMTAADEAMEFAKSRGTGTIEFYSQDINAKAQDIMKLETDLRRALERNQLELYYQPKISTADNTVMGMEALLRWNHNERGLISPAVFIPIAEDSNMIIDIGEWVIHEACRQNQMWHAQGLGRLRVSVNVSAQQVQPVTLYTSIKRALEDSGLPPELLVVEITESMAMENPEEKMELLKEIRSLGVDISIDDFGTGYSSLSYLNKMPVAELKIDRAFIVDTPDSDESVAVVKAIVAMSHGLGLKVVAEGVEDFPQLDLLESLACEYIQGFIYSKPLPAKEFEQYVSEF